MKGIILFQSKYGATKKYANWLSDKTGFSCVETKKAKIEMVQKFDTIILGGAIYASGISGLSFLKKHFNALMDKKIVIFCIGASPYDEATIQAMIQHNLKKEWSDIPFYYCRGAWDMAAMTAIDRNLCRVLRKSVKKKNPNDYQLWEKALMAAGDESCDWTDIKYIKPILDELNR
ncbi:flavodoxin domain-containing protein [Enterococcus alishanensis]